MAWLPLLAFCLVATTFIISYTISQVKDIVVTALPFISDTGTTSPASCWFGLFLNATAYIFLMVMVVRYLQIREHLTHEQKKVKVINIISLVIGILAALGVSMVACFQETNVKSMHLIGAFMAFIGGIIYGYMHAYLTHKLIKESFFNHKWLMVIRIILATIMLGVMVMMIIAMRHSGYKLPPYTSTNRPYEHKGWYFTATSCEWTLGISFFFYVLSLSYEFATIKVLIVVKNVPNSYFVANPEAGVKNSLVDERRH